MCVGIVKIKMVVVILKRMVMSVLRIGLSVFCVIDWNLSVVVRMREMVMIVSK